MRGQKVDIDSYISQIAPFLQVGCSLLDACQQADIPYQTVQHYCQEDEKVRRKVEVLKNYAVVLARQVVVKAIQGEDADMALKYLERKMPDEFSLKVKHESEVNLTVGLADAERAQVEGAARAMLREASTPENPV